MKNKPKVMILEFIMLIQILVTILIDLIYMDKNLIEQSTIAYSTITLIIILVKLNVEGPRTPFLMIILDHILTMISRQSFHQSQIILSLIVIISLVSFILLVYLPLYQFPLPSGEYDVGFKELTFKINKKPVSVYYPVDKNPINRKYKTKIFQIRNRKYINDLYNALKSQMFLIPPPIQLIQMCLGHLYKSTMEVHNNAPITSEILKPIPIIFCNGLLAVRDHYSCILRELASQGYVVFAPQLDEEFNILSMDDLKQIKQKKIKLEEDIELCEKLKLIRNEQLNQRVQCVQLLIDKIANDNFIKTIFKSKTIQLNMDKLIGAGHSFGGSTVYETAIIDKRINGGLILYDPWFIPLPKTSINQNILLPILCINSETFKNIPLVKENILISKHIFEAQRQKTFLSLELCGSDHAHQSDLVYIMPGEMKLMKEINNIENITQFTTSNLRLTNLFITKAILQQISPKKVNSILKEFDEYIDKNYQSKNKIYNILSMSR